MLYIKNYVSNHPNSSFLIPGGVEDKEKPTSTSPEKQQIMKKPSFLDSDLQEKECTTKHPLRWCYP